MGQRIRLRDIVSTSKINKLCFDETKLDASFTDTKFKNDGHQFLLFRKDGVQKVVRKNVFVQEGIIAKSLAHFESLSIKSFFIELAISKRKWCILFAYRPLNSTKVTSLLKFQIRSVKV